MMSTVRLFDVEEARRLVPFLLDTFGRIRHWMEEARAATAILRRDTLSREEVKRLNTEVDETIGRIRQELARLEDAGIAVKDAEGLVDFPALLGNRHVYLCWKFPEQSIDYWHELEAGFSGRQPIGDDAAFARSWLS
jgi:hypothetical protein